jgi:hypothetical protein
MRQYDGSRREKALCKQGGHDYSIMLESSRKERKELALHLETAGLEKPLN